MRNYNRKFTEVVTYYLEKAFRNYQCKWLAVDAPFVANTGPRQVGKDFTYSGGVAIDCLAQPETIWNIVSATRVQAAQFLDDAKRHITAILAGASAELPAAYIPKILENNATEITFSNGSAIRMLSATAESIVGNRGNFLFNEVGIRKNAEEVFEVAFPIVTGARDNGKNARFIMVSNATRRGKFYDQFINGNRSKSFHKIIGTWRGYFEQWLSSLKWSKDEIEKWINKREKLYRQTVGERAYNQWYNCIFGDSGGAYFDDALLDACSFDLFGLLDGVDKHTKQSIGMDIGRKVHPTVIQPLLEVGSKWVQAKHLRPTMRGARYDAQLLELERIADSRNTIAIIPDKTGIGDGLAEQIENAYPAITEGFHFTEASKWALVSNAKTLLESGIIVLDASDFDLRAELESIEVEEGKHKSRVIFPENKTNPDNPTHCDNASALFLGLWGCKGLQSEPAGIYDEAPRRGASSAPAQPSGAIMGAWRGFETKRGW